ncbi:MAG TPA: AAA family ATPase [Candidatus Kapabacteria bacterium]|nr:AAA family ATPase [Candidatus Kapabacteria bacterium]
MKNLPLGIQTFRKIIEENRLYVDKTKDIYNLLAQGGQYYFLSRPRLFGKSLLVSTLKEIFLGNKELFKGLWIEDKIEWINHPVIHIDFSVVEYETAELMKESLVQTLDGIAAGHGIQLTTVSYKTRFGELIRKLSSKGKVVILIDEYDKPIIDFVENREIAIQNRDILKSFYSTLKGLDEHLKFVFITGVSKFSKVSIFSDLNNLTDITLDETYATMLGYTHRELLEYFDEEIEALLKKEEGTDGTKDELVNDIKYWYNGYSWDGTNFVYNPFSILNLFQKRKFANYWFESGSPSFLVKLARKEDIALAELENYKAGEEVFSAFDIDKMQVVSILFQTGYLTIKEIIPISRTRRFYILSFPNAEVKESLLVYLLGDMSPKYEGKISVMVDDLKAYLKTGNLEKFFELMRSIFAQISYDMFVKDREGYYQTVIYLILKLTGINIDTEVETNLGRIDAVIHLEKVIYVMEFKIGTPEEALKQIKEKKYYERYLSLSKTIMLIGIGIDTAGRNIKEYKIEKVQF